MVAGGRSLLPYLCNLNREVICKYMRLDIAQKGLYVLIKVPKENNTLGMVDSLGIASGLHHNLVFIFLVIGLNRSIQSQKLKMFANLVPKF